MNKLEKKTSHDKSSEEAISALLVAKAEILDFLAKVINAGSFNYRTFGTDIEKYISDFLVNFFTRKGFIDSKDDYIIAPHKNYFPDFELKTSPPIAIEFKSGNINQQHHGEWVLVKNSENDLGTVSEWPKRMSRYSGENIYYVFVIYDFNDKIKKLRNVEIEPFYKFIGVANKGKVLKYREKDGNLRPKDFDIDSPIKTLEQFKEMLERTVVYRCRLFEI